MSVTKREIEILEAIAQGDDHSTAATRFNSTARSVSMNLLGTRRSLGATTTEQAIVISLVSGLMAVPKLNGRSFRLDLEEIDVLNRLAAGEKVGGREDNTLVAAVLSKLHAVNRCNAVYIAYGAGLIEYRGRSRVKKGSPSQVEAFVAISQTADLGEAATLLRVSEQALGGYVKRTQKRLRARNVQHALKIALQIKEVPFKRTNSKLTAALDEQHKAALLLMADGFTDTQIKAKLGGGRLVNNAVKKMRAKGRSNAILIMFQEGVLP